MRLKTRNFGGINAPKVRLAVLFALLAAFCAVFFGRLVSLQFASKGVYEDAAVYANSVSVTVPTVRGEISDVSGTTLVSNKIIYNITLDKKQIPAGETNNTVYSLINFFNRLGIEYTDLLPITKTAPYTLEEGYSENSDSRRYVRNYANYMGLEAENLEKTDTALYDTLHYRYGLGKTTLSDSEKRLVIGLRFTLDVNAYSSTLPCVLVKDVDSETISKISDSLHNFPGLEITTSTERYYNLDGIASHILGWTDVIYAEDADYYRERGYNLTEIVGKTGVEAAFEEYLRGKNGKKSIIMSEDGEEILGENITEESKPGYTVRLTIDAEMQKVAEQALQEVITEQSRKGRNTYDQYDGEDANAGAVVVLDPRDCSVRVSASYPTYNLNTYDDDKAELVKDEENAPLLNRATGGIYEPGSTYKIVTAAAALHYGVTTPTRVIYDKGEFEDYPTYKPHCWVLDRYGYTHGYQTLLEAIQNSCNYYFFRVGKELGVDKTNEYAKSLGLGVKTGIEIGESSGIIVSPAYKESIGLAWNPGDTLQTAIGQQHLFTPLQLASFISTMLSGGTRYETHLFDSAIDYSTGEVIAEYQPKILSEVEIPEETTRLIKEAMRKVVDDGTASATFLNYKYPVGGKTGTAEVAGGSDNVIFVGFAPYDEPEIVVSVVLEHGYKSGNAAEIAKRIFDCYFSRLYPEDFGIVAVEPEEEDGTDPEQSAPLQNGMTSDETVYRGSEEIAYID